MGLKDTFPLPEMSMNEENVLRGFEGREVRLMGWKTMRRRKKIKI